MKQALLAVLAICGLALGTVPASASLVFAGSWILGNGPYWQTNPQVVSGQQEAALMFGGSPGQYEISTTGSDPNAIDHLAWADNDQGAPSQVAQDFSASSCGGGYNCSDFVNDATSTYVLDHTCNNRFANLALTCDNTGDAPGAKASTSYVNYAFLNTGVVAAPEPSSFLLIGTMVVGLGLLRRRAS